MIELESSIQSSGVFDPEAIVALGVAYERAVSQLHASDQSELVREIIAKRILAVAMKGERDLNRLCRSALAGPSWSMPGSFPKCLAPG